MKMPALWVASQVPIFDSADLSCLGLNPSRPVTFAVTTTKNAIEHLRVKHRIGPDGPIAIGSTPSQQTIVSMFGNAPPRITFNEDVFKHFLLQWVVAHDISFRMCEDSFFRRLCAYLAACQPDYSGVYRALPRGEQILDVVSYWRAKMSEPQWRDLARMALDYLTIPAMSAEPERVFSAAKITLTDP